MATGEIQVPDGWERGEVPGWADPSLLERWNHRSGGRLEKWARAYPDQVPPAWPEKSCGAWSVYPPHLRDGIAWGSTLHLVGRVTFNEPDPPPPFAWAEGLLRKLQDRTFEQRTE